MTEESKRYNSEYRNFFYVLIIAKNIYSIKYLKKNRRAGKQLEKVLKSSADRMILRPCLAERWVITHETPLQAFANLGQSPSVWSGEIIQYRKKGKQTMTETTYDIIAKSLDRISMELHQADENNDFLRIGLLSGQLKAIKENLHRLLWIELPELNESYKIEAVSKSTTGMFFHPGIFEMDAMRQAFFKRQAKHFFDNEAEQQAYIEHAEKEYLEATITLKDILFNSKDGTRKVSKDCLIEQFEEAMQ